MNFKKLYLTGSLTMMSLAFIACSHDDFFDKDAEQNKQKHEFATNFVKKYGAIDTNQTWDFCSMEPTFSLPSDGLNGTFARTRTGESNFDRTTGELTVEKDVIAYMLDHMPQGKNNTEKGNPFKMTVPGNAFTIVPIFQGYARYYWQLWMHVEGLGDHLVWSKGEAFFYRNDSESEWTEPGTGIAGIDRNAASENPCEVKGPSYTYANLPEGAKMYFYLKVWSNGSEDGYKVYQRWLENPNASNVTIKECSSLDNMMLSLENAQKPQSISVDNDVTIIGCEDNETGSDKDYEDLVFMIYGHPVPPTERVEEVETAKTKRYFMEDLGSTDDFDFNDVVVDVQTERKKITYIYKGDTDELVSKTETSLPDQAIVRAAGGTMDFTLTIGSTTWTKSEHLAFGNMWNTGWGGTAINYTAVLDVPFTVEDFDAARNNITVSVVGNGGSGDVKTITFPKAGEAPMILAVDPTTNWMNERVSIPKAWFTEE